VEQAPPGAGARHAAGETGYATLEIQRGLVGHSTAWSASAHGHPAKEERVKAMRQAALRPVELALFRPALEEGLEEAYDAATNPDRQGSRHPLEDARQELSQVIALARQFGIDTSGYSV